MQCFSCSFLRFSLEWLVSSPFLQPQEGLSNTSGSFVDGIFECGFAREKRVENAETIFDLEKPWNILFASGRTKNGNYMCLSVSVISKSLNFYVLFP